MDDHNEEPTSVRPDEDIIDAEFEDVVTEQVRDQPSEVGETADAATGPPAPTAELRPLSEPEPSRRPTSSPPADLSSAEERRVLESLGKLMCCDARPRALLQLARHGEAHVGALAATMNIDPAKLGGHLNRMAEQGLLFPDHRGRQHWFQINPARIRLLHDKETGEDLLRINSRPGGLAVVIVMPAPPAAPARTSSVTPSTS